MLKSSKTFIISNEKVNNPGFRVLTPGIRLDKFLANPIMLWMHRRSTGDSANEVLPLGYWEDLRVDSNKILYGVPVFDDKDTFAKSIYDKVESGVLRCCSPALTPIEVSESPELMLPGQTGPTVTVSELKEVSIVDIPGNAGAVVVQLCNNEGRIIQLSEAMATGMLSQVKSSVDEREAYDLIELAYVTGKINEAGKFSMIGMVMNDNKAVPVKNLMLSMQSTLVSPDEKIKQYGGRYLKLSYDDIDRQIPGGTRMLRNDLPELYKMKFAEKFGRLPAELK